jgi:hypothetical protein
MGAISGIDSATMPKIIREEKLLTLDILFPLMKIKNYQQSIAGRYQRISFSEYI